MCVCVCACMYVSIGTVYSEADQPFVLAFFEQRDLTCQVEFETKVLTPALANYKELDMAKFATSYTFAEFFWLCCGFVRCIAAEMKVEIFPDDAVEKFCQTDINEHWAVYLTQLHIREAKVDGLNELLNQRAEELSCNLQRTRFTVTPLRFVPDTSSFFFAHRLKRRVWPRQQGHSRLWTPIVPTTRAM